MRSAGWRRTSAALGVLAATIALVLLVRQAPPTSEVGDGAVLELYTLDARGGSLLLGPYSRFGWRHPGPLYLFLQVPWYTLSGDRTAGMQAGALALNLAAIVLVAWTLVCVSDAVTAVAVAALLGTFVVRASGIVASPWNPHVIILPLAAFLVLSSSLAAGAIVALPWIVIVGSFLVQTHVGTAPFVCLVGAVAVGAAVRDARSRYLAQRSALRTACVVAASIAVLLWLLPIAEQVMHTPGNVTRLWRFFAIDRHAGQPMTTAFAAWSGAMSAAFRPRLAVPLGLPVRAAGPGASIFAAAETVAVAVAAMYALRARRRFLTWLAALGFVAAVVALWSVTRVAEGIVDHEVFWISIVGALNAASIVAAAGDALASIAASPHLLPPPWIRRAAAAALVVVAAAVGTRELVRGVRQPGGTRDDRIVRALVAPTRAYLADAGIRHPLVRVRNDVWEKTAGVLLQLAKARVPFTVDENAAVIFGEQRLMNGTEDGELVFAGRREQPELAARPENHLVVDVAGVFVDARPLMPAAR